MIWKFITFFVRKLDPEIAHKITIKFFKLGLHPRLNKIGIPISNPNRLKEDKCLILAPPMKRIVTPIIPIIIAVL